MKGVKLIWRAFVAIPSGVWFMLFIMGLLVMAVFHGCAVILEDFAFSW